MQHANLKNALVTTAVTASTLLTSAGAAGQSTDPNRPNILFIFTDDHALQAISAYGSQINETPNIDRLANEGMVFENCFCTNSISAPSRAVILTGKFSHLNGVPVNGRPFDGSQPTFPRMLQDAGYQTAMIGKWHLRTDPTGFDFWNVLIGQGPYYNPDLKTPDGTVQHMGYTTDIITDLALDWLGEGRDQDKPFLLMCQHKAPHRNWMPGPDHLTMYEDVEIPEPPTLFDDYSNRASGAANQEMSIARHMTGMYDLKLDEKFESPAFQWEQNFRSRLTPEQLEAWNAVYEPRNRAFREAFEAGELTGDELTSFKYQRYIKDYLRCIASVDDNIGRMLDYLDDTGLADNTIVIYSSDQGFYLGEHGWYDKRWMYEESLHMPFIVRWPGNVPAGTRSEALVQNLDFAPTFLDVAGLPKPADMQGASMQPILRGEDPEDWRDSVYYHYYEFPGVHAVPRHYGVRTDRYKLIHYYQLGEWELFDLVEDPHELNSVYDEPRYAKIVSRLRKELRRLQEQYDDASPEGPIGEVLQPFLRQRAADTPASLAMQLEDAVATAPARLELMGNPLLVGAHCSSTSDGVILAQGGESYGFSLYIKDRRPHFAIRSDSGLYETASPHQLKEGQATHLAGELRADGTIHLYIDGREVASASSAIIAATPSDGLSVSKDTGSAVGAYESEFPYTGNLRDIRVYIGSVDNAILQRWARGTHSD
jgi:arylsulfatase A-like enzyme